MKGRDFKNEHTIAGLVSEYEAMSQQGTVGFIEETVFFKLIDYYENENQPEKALGVVEHALAQHNYSANFYIRKAQLLFDKDCDHIALECLETAETYSPNSLEIKLLKVEAFINLKYHEDAFDIIEELKGYILGKELSEVYLYEAYIYESLAKHGLMFESLRHALINDPKNRKVLERIWWAVEFSGMYAESIALHLQIIDEEPYSELAWFNLGQAYSGSEDFDQAIEAFEYAFIINKKYELAYRECAEACIHQGYFEKALECYSEAIEQDIKPDADLLMKIGFCYEAQHDLRLAKSFYNKAIKLDPQNNDIHFRLGECYTRLKQWDNAIASYEKAIVISDRREEYYASLAEAYYQVGDENKAYGFFQKAADTAPEISKYWIQFASFLMDTDMAIEALDTLDEAEMMSEGTELLYCRVACLFQLGRRKEGLFLLGQALTDNFGMHDALFDLQPDLETDTEVLAVIAVYRKAA